MADNGKAIRNVNGYAEKLWLNRITEMFRCFMNGDDDALEHLLTFLNGAGIDELKPLRTRILVNYIRFDTMLLHEEESEKVYGRVRLAKKDISDAWDLKAQAYIDAYEAIGIILAYTEKALDCKEGFQIDLEMLNALDEHFIGYHQHNEGAYPEEAETCQFLIRGNLAKIGLPQANKFIVQAWEAAKQGHIFQCVSRGKLLKISKPYEDAEKAYRRVFDECNKQIQEVFTKKRNVLMKQKIVQQ